MFFRKFVRSLLVSTLLGATVPVLAASPTEGMSGNIWTVDAASSKAGFVATGSPGFLRITGEGGKVEGSGRLAEDGVNLSGTFQVDLTSLVTGISLRDQHMKEKYLETHSFPKATLSLASIKIPAAGLEVETTFQGDLTLKGVTRPITGEARLVRGTNEIRVLASFPVLISEFPIGVPSWLGVTVAEKVNISVEFTASQNSALASRP
jgi:polyisoprenoid-binding protein YceI